MIIRKAVLADAAGIARVHVDSWKTTYQKIVPQDYLDSLKYETREEMWLNAIPNGGIFVAEQESGRIVGFASGGKERSKKYHPEYEGELYAIYLLKECQRQGLGKLLVKAVIEHLHQNHIKSMIVMVLEGNPSKNFYESLGAKKIDLEVVDIGGEKLNELVLAWEDIRPFL
ncbi:GNAT family N-acetyltransferase [Heyndrickxia acidicola]|uniref:GNAT family N-acetyltransferase n=1 Tax=Heyndrickxia acidicola TaxID=209389 RepID=A0ABU6MM35_9BACI|nr:GNAT family N-acetyltransferase [Heyndrickxia acidicola]MED1205748.1 GNAT family N-acetyltransferase [Heyndrickxia acidicola]